MSVGTGGLRIVCRHWSLLDADFLQKRLPLCGCDWVLRWYSREKWPGLVGCTKVEVPNR
jgi:hypothetical protein